MIGVVGGNYVTLRRLAVASGMRVYSRQAVEHYDAVFNTSLVASRMPTIDSRIPVLNKRLITNKMEALRLMANSGMTDHVPEYRTDRQYEGRWIIKPYASQCGAGVEYYRNGQSVPYGCYLQKDTVKFREFRAHVALWLDNPVFTIQEKKPKPELWAQRCSGIEYRWPADQPTRALLPLTWNVESGFYFKRNTDPDNRADKVQRFQLLGRVEELGIKAVKALKYQYGAVDILMNDDRELFVVEVNSHPAIKNENSIEIYKRVLHTLAEMSRSEITRRMFPDHSTPAPTTRHVFVRAGHGGAGGYGS